MTVFHQGKKPVYLQIADALRASIEAGEYGPGAKLPSETDLMTTYRVARLTARKAVRVLAADGLVEVVTGRGAFVAEHPPGQPAAPPVATTGPGVAGTLSALLVVLATLGLALMWLADIETPW